LKGTDDLSCEFSRLNKLSLRTEQGKELRRLIRASSPAFVWLMVSVVLILATFSYSPGSSSTQPTAVQLRQTPAPKTASAPSLSQPQSLITRPDIGFASREKLVGHYKKHGWEFGAITLDEYLLQAQELRDRPAGGNILEAVRADGVIVRFDRATGAFIAFNPDGVIRTYFRPNAGEAYFRRQTRR
jgi:pyocin large subunit-like protein